MSKKCVASCLLVLIWMSLIFMISHTPNDASYEASKEIVSSVVGNTATNTMVLNGMTLNKLVRKLAHVVEYFVLSMLVINALKNYNLTNKQLYMYSLTLCTLYACSDEIHQYFVGRSASISDILIDTCGIVIGILLYKLYLEYKSKRLMN